ncbi:hypothetical protein L227DRAFT_439386 [Lentinus tigrinus ALCF2SS1-6]|uniref:Uncharacterized protein n=1 Tax=Lentinus tigrinus ALCF2SS1-6 TaxID=1328759 RepID=A0A5C2RNU2_9APHY|nr:hypothetical protein L227DRAFT_439386 [Lentinus tigrinus ALCF2SS1-6]
MTSSIPLSIHSTVDPWAFLSTLRAYVCLLSITHFLDRSSFAALPEKRRTLPTLSYLLSLRIRWSAIYPDHDIPILQTANDWIRNPSSGPAAATV